MIEELENVQTQTFDYKDIHHNSKIPGEKHCLNDSNNMTFFPKFSS
jgi:hypothetical protein